jgi:hypothetical protein
MCKGKLGSHLNSDRTVNMGQGSHVRNCTKIWCFMVLNNVRQYLLVKINLQ